MAEVKVEAGTLTIDLLDQIGYLVYSSTVPDYDDPAVLGCPILNVDLDNVEFLCSLKLRLGVSQSTTYMPHSGRGIHSNNQHSGHTNSWIRLIIPILEKLWWLDNLLELVYVLLKIYSCSRSGGSS